MRRRTTAYKGLHVQPVGMPTVRMMFTHGGASVGMAVVLCDDVLKANRNFSVAFREAQLRAAFVRVATRAQGIIKCPCDADLVVRAYLFRNAHARSVWAVHPLRGDDVATFAQANDSARSATSGETIFDAILM